MKVEPITLTVGDSPHLWGAKEVLLRVYARLRPTILNRALLRQPSLSLGETAEEIK